MSFDLNFSFPAIPSPEEMEAQMVRWHAERLAAVAAPGRFIGASLGAWLERVAAAGVPVVPAERLATLPREVYFRADSPTPSDSAAWDDLNARLAGVPEGAMARWDACSGIELKEAMSAGAAPRSARADLNPGDPRAFDIHCGFPADSFAVWQRPWVDALVIDGFPVEFRVFVRDSRVIGVSSYYPQRALPHTDAVAAFVAECTTKTERVLAHLASRGDVPWMQSYGAAGFDPSAVHATLDFLIRPDGEALFLEAGPPFGAGAHPCAFIDRPVQGVALALAPGVLLR